MNLTEQINSGACSSYAFYGFGEINTWGNPTGFNPFDHFKKEMTNLLNRSYREEFTDQDGRRKERWELPSVKTKHDKYRLSFFMAYIRTDQPTIKKYLKNLGFVQSTPWTHNLKNNSTCAWFYADAKRLVIDLCYPDEVQTPVQIPEVTSETFAFIDGEDDDVQS